MVLYYYEIKKKKKQEPVPNNIIQYIVIGFMYKRELLSEVFLILEIRADGFLLFPVRKEIPI